MGNKINSNEVYDKFKQAILIRGIRMDLKSITAIGEYLGYDGRNFRNRVNRMSFTVLELKDLFRRLHFTNDEIIEIIKG